MESTVGKVIKCRAAIVWEVKQPFCIEEIEVAPPQANEVRIRMVSTGLCHSDLSLVNGAIQISNKFPTVAGHEGAGIVESVGEKVTKLKAGDHVIPLFVGQCQECSFCATGKTNICLTNRQIQTMCTLKDGTTRLKCKGQMIHQYMSLGTFAEYTVVEDFCLVKINDKAPLEKVCLLGCAIPTGLGAALNSAKVTAGSTCAIWGLGGIGLATAMGCRKAGAAKIYGIDINSEKFKMARKFGCTDFVNPNDYKGQNFAEKLRDMSNGGFDFTFECVGNVTTMRTAIDASHPAWGHTTLVGVSSFDKDLNVFPFDILVGRSIGGTFFGGYKAIESVPKLVDAYMGKEIMVDEFITHTLKLDEINEGFKWMQEGKALRSVIIYK